MIKQTRKPLKWIGSAKRDLDAMPEDVKDVFGHAIDLAQAGGKHPDAKAMGGFGSAGLLEVVEDFRSNTYAPSIRSSFRDGFMSCIAFRRSPRAALKRPRRIWI